MVFSVIDSGAGIPPDLLGRIFEPFFTTKSPEKWTSTVASIVKRHKGAMDVKSELGKGTEFRLYLPATKTEWLAESKEKSSSLPAGRGEVILVVDDEQVVVELVKSTLENYGYRVLTAFNGLKAIACFEAHKQEIRLLITDTDMPYLNGIKAMRAVQKIEPNLPIILASGTELDTEQFNAKSEIVRLRKPIRCGPAPEYHCQGVGDLGRGLRFGISSTG